MPKLFDKIEDCIDRDDVECLKKIVKTKKNANATGIVFLDRMYQTISPLCYAIVREAKKSAEFLIDKGADVNFYMKADGYALVQLIEKRWLDLAQRVIDNKLPITKEVFVEGLKNAMENSNNFKPEEVNRFIDSLISHVAGKKLTQYSYSNDVFRLLSTAVSYAHPEVFKHFISTHIPNVEDYIDKDGNGILHSTAEHGNLEKVKYLVEERNISPNVVNHYGSTPLHNACWELTKFEQGGYNLQKAMGLSDIIEYLVSKNANLEATTISGYTPTGILIYDGLMNIPILLSYGTSLEALIQRTKVIVNLIKKLAPHAKPIREALKTYAPGISETILNKKIKRTRELQYEILMLPEKVTILQELVSKLCNPS